MEQNQMLTLKDAAKLLEWFDLLTETNLPEQDVPVGYLSYNSKDIRSNTLFVCKGINFKKNYLDDAISSGIIGYVSERRYQTDEDIPYIMVTDIRKALAVLSAWFYHYDETSPQILAVTGTKGKSTVVYLLTNILKAAGFKPAFATTVDIYDGKDTTESTLTTPESLECHKIISAAKENECDHFVMEVSSQAFKMERIFGLQFQYGVFVNIANDHISPNEHCDFEDYFQCKLEIVKMYENAIVNLDDPNADRVLDAAKNSKRCITYSVSDPNADIHAKNILKTGLSSTFMIVTPEYEFETEIMMPGMFNVSNALAATAVAYLKGIDQSIINEGIRNTLVPGRMNIYEKNGYTIIVDYAHNKNSISIALNAIKEYYPDKKITILFGCPGNKALQRRQDMAEESAKYAQYVYVSSEDPSYEDPYQIAEEVKRYLDRLDCPSEIIVDRAEAIKKAITEMKQDELLLIAGKGSEHYQVVNGIAVAYQGDTVLADRYINELK